MPTKRSPAKVDRAVWEIVPKERAAIRWVRVVEKVLNAIGGNQEEVMSVGKFEKYKAEVSTRLDVKKGKASSSSLRNKVESEKRVEI